HDEVFTIGWVNTWDYAQQAPSTWGKGVWSLPRKLTLYETSGGMRLRQQPATALESLRGTPFKFGRRLKAGTVSVPAIAAMDNQYELDLCLKPATNDVAGLNLCCGDGRKVRMSYDASSGFLTVDRTNSTDEPLPKFSRMAFTRIDGEPSFRIFVDKSTIEIFVNDGEKVLTLLTYAGDAQTGVELFSGRGGTVAEITAWPMRSIWDSL
ncbi:MAG: GH32 C-terminal domain-containing protein, partial [Duncaniella sp.]|nr:GH32 C-terminal domain-containing protein [Duncaniella sp.]